MGMASIDARRFVMRRVVSLHTRHFIMMMRYAFTRQRVPCARYAVAVLSSDMRAMPRVCASVARVCMRSSRHCRYFMLMLMIFAMPPFSFAATAAAPCRATCYAMPGHSAAATIAVTLRRLFMNITSYAKMLIFFFADFRHTRRREVPRIARCQYAERVPRCMRYVPQCATRRVSTVRGMTCARDMRSRARLHMR